MFSNLGLDLSISALANVCLTTIQCTYYGYSAREVVGCAQILTRNEAEDKCLNLIEGIELFSHRHNHIAGIITHAVECVGFSGPYQGAFKWSDGGASIQEACYILFDAPFTQRLGSRRAGDPISRERLVLASLYNILYRSQDLTMQKRATLMRVTSVSAQTLTEFL